MGRDAQVVRPVDPGPQVLVRGDAGQQAELIGQVRLVAIPVPGGNGGPVDVALPVKVPD